MISAAPLTAQDKADPTKFIVDTAVAAILPSHAVAGEIPLSEAAEAGGATTLQGSEVSVGFEDGFMNIGDSTLVNADIKASNSMVHAIERVLMPGARQICHIGIDSLEIVENQTSEETLDHIRPHLTITPVDPKSFYTNRK